MGQVGRGAGYLPLLIDDTSADSSHTEGYVDLLGVQPFINVDIHLS